MTSVENSDQAFQAQATAQRLGRNCSLSGPFMENLKRITDETKLVLGDWVCTRPDHRGHKTVYRLTAWSANTERWMMYRDGIDPWMSGHPGLLMLPEDLMAKGFFTLGQNNGRRTSRTPVYVLKQDLPGGVLVFPAGTDPRSIA